VERSVGEGGRINIPRGGGGTTGLENKKEKRKGEKTKARRKPRLEIRAGINVTEKEQRKYDKSDFFEGNSQQKRCKRRG
jgi:hypothetical protein